MKNSFIYKKVDANQAPDWFLLSIGNQVKVKEFGCNFSISVNGTILENGDTVSMKDYVLSVEKC